MMQDEINLNFKKSNYLPDLNLSNYLPDATKDFFSLAYQAHHKKYTNDHVYDCWCL